MTKEELIVLLELTTLYSPEYLESLSVEELRDLYFKKGEYGE